MITFDPKMPLTDIWMDFHTGQIHVHDDGRIEKKVFTKMAMQLSADDVTDVQKFREKLHSQLDELINRAAMEILHLQTNGVKYTIA